MKKVITLITIIALTFVFCVSAIAVEGENYIYDFGNVEVIFDESTQFSPQVRELIASKLVFGDLIGPEGDHIENIICTLFGHSYNVETVTTITHNVRDTQPTCLKETYEVSICSRCNDVQSELIGTKYIYCTDH